MPVTQVHSAKNPVHRTLEGHKELAGRLGSTEIAKRLALRLSVLKLDRATHVEKTAPQHGSPQLCL